jgi:myosin-crossreactive antigen
MIKRHAEEDALFYLVGGGIASLAAAAFLIRDGGVKGQNIRILEESAELGGSLDAGADGGLWPARLEPDTSASLQGES